MICRMSESQPPTRSFTCPTCQRRIDYAGDTPKTYPFCSQRCQMVDLGRWLAEAYAIDRDLTAEDLADPDINRQLPPDFQ